MKVESGWSAEVATSVWDKVKVELDESDFQALAVEKGIYGLEISTEDKFLVLENETRRLVCAYVAVGHADLRSNAKDKIASLNERQRSLIEKIKNKNLGSVSEEGPAAPENKSYYDGDDEDI